MSDLFDANGVRLPSTGLRQDMGAAVKAEMRQGITDTVHDRLQHAIVVAAGPVNFRIVFVRAYGPAFGNDRGQCDELANAMYTILVAIWRDRYQTVGAREHDGLSPQSFLDKVHVASPLSEKEIEKEIDDNWVVEIAGDERAMANNYEGSARVRKGGDLGARRRH